MEDLFVLENYRKAIIAIVDISTLPSNIDKLIGAGLDPLVYRCEWVNPNLCRIREFWWNTTPYLFYRIDSTKLSYYSLALAHYKDTHMTTNLPTGLVASASPFHLNRMI